VRATRRACEELLELAGPRGQAAVTATLTLADVREPDGARALEVVSTSVLAWVSAEDVQAALHREVGPWLTGAGDPLQPDGAPA